MWLFKQCAQLLLYWLHFWLYCTTIRRSKQHAYITTVLTNLTFTHTRLCRKAYIELVCHLNNT